VNAVMTVLGVIGLTQMGKETSTARNAGLAGVVQGLGEMLKAPFARRRSA
jgi:hypothetical protein